MNDRWFIFPGDDDYPSRTELLVDNRPRCANCGSRGRYLIGGSCLECRNQFNTRIGYLVSSAHDVVTSMVKAVQDAGYHLAGIVGLFSGGNDSTTLAHMFKDEVTHFGHANTGFGIEETRQYVRDTSAKWNVPLLEKYPEPGYGYRELVLGECKSRAWYAKYDYIFPGGFPGPAQHPMMFQKLKERGMGQMRNELIGNPRRERVIFLGGRRAAESSRRMFRASTGDMSYSERRGSVMWLSPLLEWTKLDLNEYRRLNPDVPRNETSDLLHMSGECECGCYARPGEYDELRDWRPGMADQIDELEKEIATRDLDIEPKTCKWGWNTRGKCAGGLCNN